MIAELRHIHRQRLRRLRELAVEVKELSASQSQAALARFAAAFIGAERAEAFLGAVQAARESHRELDYGRWLWRGEPPPALQPRFGWLSDWRPGVSCVRFDLRVALTTVSLDTYGMLDEWAFSWPGVYVSFENQRAMLVSLEREVMCYDLLAPGKAPYR